VSAICPGFTYSEFHDVNGMRARVSRMPRFLWTDAARVAREGCDAVEAGKAVHVPGRVNQAVASLSSVLPRFVVTGVNRYAGRAYRDST
jgi:short-subunit dehydrogenase